MAPGRASPGPSRLPSAGMALGEGRDHVTCRLCRRRFKMVTKTHLVRAHGYPSRDALGVYKQRFGLSRVRSLRTIRAQRRSLLRHYEKQGRRWTKARLVSEAKMLLPDGRPPGSPDVILRLHSLRKAAERSFGSWRRFLRAAGFDADRLRRQRRWSKAAVLRAVRSLGENRLHRKMATKEDSGLVHAAASRFGSWDAALRAAGRNTERVRKIRHWDPDLVLREIRRWAPGRRRGEVLRKNPALVAIASFYFRDWSTALSFAGIGAGTRPAFPDWSPGRILAEMRRTVRTGKSLAWHIVFYGRPELVGAALKCFGSWGAAVRASGFRVSGSMTRQEWTAPELIGFLRRLRRKYGSVTPARVRRASPPGYASPVYAVGKLFGSLRNAMSAKVSRRVPASEY